MIAMNKDELLLKLKQMVERDEVKFDTSSAFLFNRAGQETILSILAQASLGNVKTYPTNGPTSLYSVSSRGDGCAVILGYPYPSSPLMVTAVIDIEDA